MPGRAAPALALALTAAAAACGAAPPAPPPLPAPPPASTRDAPPASARYLVVERQRIEPGDDDRDRVIVNGLRMELSGSEIARVIPGAHDLEGGARAPAWLPAGPARYVFWWGRHLYGAATFDGALQPLGVLPAEAVVAGFDWIGGVGLRLAGGAVVVPVEGGALRRLGVPAVVDAVAADARRAALTTALGHVLLTIDGGATWRDATADIGGAGELAVRGDAIVAVLPDGRERPVSATGALSAQPLRGSPAPPEPGLTLDGGHPLDLAVSSSGLPLADGSVLVAAHGLVGRYDPAARRVTSIAALPPGLADAECAAVRVADARLLACAEGDRATVVDLDGAPRAERSFDLAGALDMHRFVAADGEAIGYLGPCEGRPPPRDDPDLQAGNEPYNNARERTPVFCARARRDEWIEHRLDPADAADVVAWIPRAGGGAVALVARPGPFLDERERVTVRGALRVVRVGRSEPPFTMQLYGWEPAVVLDRSLSVDAGDVIEGWLSAGNSGNPVAVSIDAAGHPRAFPGPPRAGQPVTAGRYALVDAEDGRLWETLDAGRRWTEVPAPPGPRNETRVTACSPAGCRLGPYVRLGWSAPPVGGGEAPDPGRTGPPHPPPAPRLRLACSFSGAPESERVADSAGFGYTPAPQPRGGVETRVGTLGMANLPYDGRHVPTTGEIALAWLAPLDLAAVLHRAVVAVARTGVGGTAGRAHDVDLGWLLAPDGGLDTFTLASGDACFASVLTPVGIARSLGGCAPEPAVGVDLGGRVVIAHAAADAIVVSAMDAGSRRSPGLPAALRELGRTRVGTALRQLTMGIGARAGAPVLVMLDVNGDASLAPIDPERGTLGPEEPLRSIDGAALGGDPACAPRAGEARVVLPRASAFGLDRTSLRGVTEIEGRGVAVLRWSRDRVCLDALELPVRDERFDETPTPNETRGEVRKLVARFAKGGGKATLVEIGPGVELRQRVTCRGVSAGR